jgi:hypothetical protein
MSRERKAGKAGVQPKYTELFERWWYFYPRHDQKREAFESWTHAGLETDTGLRDAAMIGARKYSDNVEGVEPRYIALGSTFINNARWENYRATESTGRPDKGEFFFGGKRLRE